MATVVSFKPDKPMRNNTWARIKRIFKLTDDHRVNEEWNGERIGPDQVLVTISMHKIVSVEEFHALFNGAPLDESK